MTTQRQKQRKTIRVAVTRGQYRRLEKLPMPATYPVLAEIIGSEKALVVMAATYHDRPVEAVTR